MRTIGMAMSIDRVLRRRRGRGCPDEHPASSFEPPGPPAQDWIDPDFDAIDIGALLHDLAIMPAPPAGDDEG